MNFDWIHFRFEFSFFFECSTFNAAFTITSHVVNIYTNTIIHQSSTRFCSLWRDTKSKWTRKRLKSISIGRLVDVIAGQLIDQIEVPRQFEWPYTLIPDVIYHSGTAASEAEANDHPRRFIHWSMANTRQHNGKWLTFKCRNVTLGSRRACFFPNKHLLRLLSDCPPFFVRFFQPMDGTKKNRIECFFLFGKKKESNKGRCVWNEKKKKQFGRFSEGETWFTRPLAEKANTVYANVIIPLHSAYENRFTQWHNPTEIRKRPPNLLRRFSIFTLFQREEYSKFGMKYVWVSVVFKNYASWFNWITN